MQAVEIMYDKLVNLPEEVKQILWLFLVSFIGGIVGFVTKNSKTLEGKAGNKNCGCFLSV